ncbi:hypothetical protein B0T22DRAFT_505108 [Podospora appendiculata]|uniref:Mid2 domain-containing protein n=1 Tax=Podospora appendiculata TaxID=314037 RepID=A0AAE0XHL1_9PEZI|nr:hypothetical protein B0T22DRAFT_505108 [Podospora appendiculata]
MSSLSLLLPGPWAVLTRSLSINHNKRAVFLLAVTALLLCLADVVAGTCYKLDGTPYSKIRTDDGDWVPCDNTARISSCCSSKDYCLGNGLCLDAGANNYFSIQGCTDPSWPEPCTASPQCEHNLEAGYSFAFPCRMATNASFYYCCGATAQCCNTTAEADMPVCQGVTELSRPTLLLAGTVPATGTATTTVTVTVTSTPGVMGSAVSSPDAASSSDNNNTRTLGNGLGVGVGVGLALVAALVFLGRQMRRKRKYDHRLASAPASPAPAQQMEKPPMSGVTAVQDFHQQQQPYLSAQQDQQQQQQQLYPMQQGSPPQQAFPVQQGSPPQEYPSSTASSPGVQGYNYSSQPPAPAATLYQLQQLQGTGYGPRFHELEQH